MAGDRFMAMTVFRRVAEVASFTRAAQDLGLTSATVSKHVAFLEQHVGARLISRTTRRMSLTEAGEHFLLRVQYLLDELEEAENEVKGLNLKPKGKIRINAPMSFGLSKLPPAMDAFLNRYPETEIDLQLNDRLVDLVQQGVDVAIRIRESLPDSSLIARPLATTRSVLCAAPTYLEKAPAIEAPTDLAQHNCLLYSLHDTPDVWQIGEHRIKVSGNYRVDNSLVIRESLLAAQGVALLPSFMVDDDIHQGRLKALLQQHPSKRYTIFAMLPNGRQQTRKLRLLLEHLAFYLSEDTEEILKKADKTVD